MEETIIYNNGTLKLKHLTTVQFKSKLNNKILSGKVVGQEATNFIIWINTSVSAKVGTHDILQIAVPSGDTEYFLSKEEYMKLSDNKEE